MIVIITTPKLPPRKGYVEVEIDGQRTYKNVSTGMLVEDEMRIMGEVYRLKAELSETDYQIIKYSEYMLAGVEAPYDIAELHAKRQEIRDRINEISGEDV